MSLKRQIASLDRELRYVRTHGAVANPAATSTGAPPFTDRWGRLPKVTSRHVYWVRVPWPAVRKIANDEQGGMSDWQRRGLEIVLRVPDLRRLLARRGGFLRKNKDGTWDFSDRCYPVRDEDKVADATVAGPLKGVEGARAVGCSWWCKGEPYYVAWDGLRRKQSAVADLAQAILDEARGHRDSRLIDNYQAWSRSDGTTTLRAGIISEDEEKRRAETRVRHARVAARCAHCLDEGHATDACPHGAPT